MHDAAVVAPNCGCVCVKEYEFGMQGPGAEGFFSHCETVILLALSLHPYWNTY